MEAGLMRGHVPAILYTVDWFNEVRFMLFEIKKQNGFYTFNLQRLIYYLEKDVQFF